MITENISVIRKYTKKVLREFKGESSKKDDQRRAQERWH